MNRTLCFWRHRWAPGTCRGLVLCSVRLTRGSAGARPSVSAKRVCSSLSPIKMIVMETKTAYKWHRGWAEALHISCEVRRALRPPSTAASAPLCFFPPLYLFPCPPEAPCSAGHLGTCPTPSLLSWPVEKAFIAFGQPQNPLTLPTTSVGKADVSPVQQTALQALAETSWVWGCWFFLTIF